MNPITKFFKTYRLGKEVSQKDWSSQWLRLKEKNLLEQGDQLVDPAQNSYIINKCVNIISQNFPAAPLVLFRGSKGDSIPYESSEYDLFKKPNESMSPYDLWSATSLYFSLYGEVFWYLVQSVGQLMGTRKSPAEIIVIDPRVMKEILNTDRTLKGWIYNGTLPIEKDEVIHFKNNNPYNPYRGLSPLDAVRVELNTDYKAAKYQEAFFINGAVPSIVIKTPEEDDTSIPELKKIARIWEQRHRGSSKAHKTAILRGGMTFETVGLSQQEMDFVTSRSFTRDLILSVFGVPKVMAGFTEGVNRATAETQIRVFWQETMKPQLLRVQSKLNAEFFPRFYPGIVGRFDFRKVDELQKEFADDVKAAKDLFMMGFSRNELNQRFDLGFDDDTDIGDEKYVPLNLVPANVDIYEDQAGSNPNTDTEPQLPLPGQAERSFKKENKENIVDERILEIFSRKHASLEKLMTPKVKSFFFNQRGKVLKIYGNEEKAVDDDERMNELIALEVAEAERFIRTMAPYISQAVEAGQEIARTALNLDFELQLDRTLISNRMGFFKRANDTVFRQIKTQIFEGVKAGEPVSEISKRIKQVYNKVNSRATIIARTEVTAAMNAAQMNTYAENGIRFKKWLTAKDERVRDEHRGNGSQPSVPINSAFSNGEVYPGQASVNCRCTLLYATDEEDL